MPVEIEMDDAVREAPTAERIRVEIEKLLKDREERWRVCIEAPSAHQCWRLTATTWGFARQKILDTRERDFSFIREVLFCWLYEYWVSQPGRPGL